MMDLLLQWIYPLFRLLISNTFSNATIAYLWRHFLRSLLLLLLLLLSRHHLVAKPSIVVDIFVVVFPSWSIVRSIRVTSYWDCSDISRIANNRHSDVVDPVKQTKNCTRSAPPDKSQTSILPCKSEIFETCEDSIMRTYDVI